MLPAVVVVQKVYHYNQPTIKFTYVADFPANGLETVGVIFEISASRDIGIGVIVAEQGREQDVVGVNEGARAGI